MQSARLNLFACFSRIVTITGVNVYHKLQQFAASEIRDIERDWDNVSVLVCLRLFDIATRRSDSFVKIFSQI